MTNKNLKFKKDTLYQTVLDEVVNFSFDERTVDVFPDMINRSVPGYSTMISLTGIVASHFIEKQGLVYDLGCSLGASTLSIMRHRQHDDFSIIAVDNSQAMIDKCQKMYRDKKQTVGDRPNIQWQCFDVLELNLMSSNVILLNLVMQFIDPSQRLLLLQKCYQSLNKGGALIISEKIQLENPDINHQLDSWQQYFKKQNGYSELEVSQKRKSIEKTMLLDSITEHVGRFHAAGFSQITPIFQALNFCTWCIVK